MQRAPPSSEGHRGRTNYRLNASVAGRAAAPGARSGIAGQLGNLNWGLNWSGPYRRLQPLLDRSPDRVHRYGWPRKRLDCPIPHRGRLARFLPGFFRTRPILVAFDTTACSVRPSFLLINEIGSFSEIIWRNISTCSAFHRPFARTILLPSSAAPAVGVTCISLAVKCPSRSVPAIQTDGYSVVAACSLSEGEPPSNERA